jgi:hypothetical protein
VNDEAREQLRQINERMPRILAQARAGQITQAEADRLLAVLRPLLAMIEAEPDEDAHGWPTMPEGRA